MFDATPVDLSKLPCPEGGRWEESIIRPFHGVTYSFSLCIGNHPIACVCIGENGDVSHRTGNLWSFVHGFGSVEAAVHSVLMTLGLSPAPAPERTFTEAEVKLACAWASLIGNKRACGDEREPGAVIESIRAHHAKTGLTIESAVNDKYVGEDITAALAAAKNKEK